MGKLLGVLVMSVVELSCVAAEHPRSPALPEASLFTDAIEPELPIAAEVTDTEPSASPALTR